MRLLILGGTAFLGRHLVEAARAGGHHVTLFNRGLTNPGLFPEIEQLHGDRDGGLDVLSGATWDAVIDTSGYLPRVVRQSAEFLQNVAAHYIFISSVSVYKDFTVQGIGEEYPTTALEDEHSEEVARDYGALKARCEQVVASYFPNHSLIVRPGLIVGPHDPTDRFTYWVRRFAAGGQILVPGRRDRPVQFIDARDLADWTIRMAEAGTVGVYNATGPNQSASMADLVAALQTLSKTASPVWIDDETFLVNRGVEEWSDLPLWLADATGWPGFLTVDTHRARKRGLRSRPLVETAAATAAWDQGRDPAVPLKAGLSPERERQLLAAWFDQHNVKP